MSKPKVGSVGVVMGVTGSGKTTVARYLAERFDGVYLDADDFHPPENKAKMARGVPLTDGDRQGWLASLNQRLLELEGQGGPVFLACSALKQSYRDKLLAGVAYPCLIYLRGSQEVISSRLMQRQGHFMHPALLQSQFDVLEEPDDAAVVDIDNALEDVLVDASGAYERFVDRYP